MSDGFDVVQFVAFARTRRLTILIACAVAVIVTAAVSLVLPKKYTATASILIGAPAGQDPRGATSVSPVYLESLRTFEHVASSDSLFLRSLEHLGIRQRYAGRTIESLKRNVLHVSKPVNTRVIEISATLEDPVKAQALAQFIAEQTVILSRSLDSDFSGDVAKQAEAIFKRAELRLQAAVKASEDAARMPGADALSAELASARELKFSVDSDLSKERTELADLASQELSRKSDSAGDQPAFIARQAAAARARIADLEARDRTLQQEISTREPKLEIVRQRQDSVDAELTAARKDFESAKEKLADIRAAASFRGERLDVFDPGIVPQRPSSPNVPLNVLAALLLSAGISISYLAFRFGYDRTVSEADKRSYSLR